MNTHHPFAFRFNDNEYLTEHEILQEALKKCDLHKQVMPIQRGGYLVENVDLYNKVQLILDTPEMHDCHQFLYNLDYDALPDNIETVVDKLLNLRNKIRKPEDDSVEENADEVKDGITEDTEEEEKECLDCCSVDKGAEEKECNENTEDEARLDNIITSLGLDPDILSGENPDVDAGGTDMYLCYYSATNQSGELTNGECYSTASTSELAKVDALEKLSKIGLTDVEIFAIEKKLNVDAPDKSAVDCLTDLIASEAEEEKVEKVEADAEADAEAEPEVEEEKADAEAEPEVEEEKADAEAEPVEDEPEVEEAEPEVEEEKVEVEKVEEAEADAEAEVEAEPEEEEEEEKEAAEVEEEADVEDEPVAEEAEPEVEEEEKAEEAEPEADAEDPPTEDSVLNVTQEINNIFKDLNI